MASGLRDVVNNYTYTGAIRRRQPNHSGDLQRLRATADGYLLPNPGLGGGLNWDNFVEFLGLPELDDDRFRTPSARLANAEELGRILDEYFIRQNKYERFYGSHERRFIFGVIQSPAEVFKDPQFAHREFFVDVEHPVMGEIRMPRRAVPNGVNAVAVRGLLRPPLASTMVRSSGIFWASTREQLAHLRSEGSFRCMSSTFQAESLQTARCRACASSRWGSLSRYPSP